VLLADRYRLEEEALGGTESRALDCFTERDVVVRRLEDGEVPATHPAIVRVIDRVEQDGVGYAVEEATTPLPAAADGGPGREAMARLFDAITWLESRGYTLGELCSSHVRVDGKGRLKLRVPGGPARDDPHLALIRILANASPDAELSELDRRRQARNAASVAAALRGGVTTASVRPTPRPSTRSPAPGGPGKIPPGIPDLAKSRDAPSPVPVEARRPARGPEPALPAPATSSPDADVSAGVASSDRSRLPNAVLPIALLFGAVVVALTLVVTLSSERDDRGAEAIETNPASTQPTVRVTPRTRSTPTVRASTPAPAAVASSRRGGWWVQLLATKSADNARVQQTALRRQHPTALTGLQSRIQPTSKDGTTLYRVQFGPFRSREAAGAACSTVKARGKACMVKAD